MAHVQGWIHQVTSCKLELFLTTLISHVSIGVTQVGQMCVSLLIKQTPRTAFTLTSKCNIQARRYQDSIMETTNWINTVSSLQICQHGTSFKADKYYTPQYTSLLVSTTQTSEHSLQSWVNRCTVVLYQERGIELHKQVQYFKWCYWKGCKG